MDASVQVLTPPGAVVRLEAARVTIGRDAANDIAVDDGRVSAQHAALERAPAGWLVEDLGSLNGTYVNGQRVIGKRALQSGDDITVGDTRIAFRGQPRTVAPTTEAAAPPDLTPAQRRVLLELCRPLLSGEPFPQPASVGDVASALFLGDETVKFHLKALYEKFGIDGAAGARRVALANAAFLRRAVTVQDLRSSES